MPLMAFPIPFGKRKLYRRPSFGGCIDALAIAELAATSDTPLVFIAHDIADALYCLEEARFFYPELPINYLPDWDVLPYDGYSPTAEVTSARMIALTKLLDGQRGLTITTPTAFLSPMPPPEFIAGRVFHLRVGDRIAVNSLLERLICGGYLRVERVLAAGEFAMYGGQVDIFPPDAEHPFRLLLSDDEVEQIRFFSPETQRSIERVPELRILPMSECDMSADGIKRFCHAYVDAFDDIDGRIYQGVKSGSSPPGGEFYLPLFFESGCGRLFDYLPADCILVSRLGMDKMVSNFLHQARLRQKVVSVYESRPVLPASSLFLSENEFYLRLRNFSVLELRESEVLPFSDVAINPRADNSHRGLIEFVKSCNERVLIAVSDKGRCELLQTILHAADIPTIVCYTYVDCLAHPVSLVVAPLRSGGILPGVTVLTEAEIFGVAIPPAAKRRTRDESHAVSPDDIAVGEMVVHREYGIGRAHGLKNMVVGGEVGEFFEIEYAAEQRLFLPVSELHCLEKYHGTAELSKMGSASWRKVCRRAERQAYDAAAQLLEINARRTAAAATRRDIDRELMAKFTGAFVYSPTADQERVAEEMLADIVEAKPMDRLVAADVGFGKTEIAMRAAAAAVFSGGQAAVLAPTTLLVEQHWRTFSNRFAGFPVRIGTLTRMLSSLQRRQVLASLAKGEIDIIIGTHALISQSVSYANLSLVVIDEEHRFGVRHKEQFKKLRANVDILSLSATPIPRTLAMAFGGIRDLSIISTPPAGRLPVKTLVAPFSHAVIAEACERELLRGGQVFFVHNEIRSIHDMREQISQWLPHARIIVAYGGMTPAELEGALRDFLARRADILLCTTIVESGLDIANANTIVINRADRMGISRLHQLRGRVGRSGVQAYAYFLTPAEFDPSRKSEARLAAIQESAELGSGFFLSMRDLEIRGAGEILGVRQSGDIEAVGFAMYQRMVNDAAKKISKAPDIESDIGVSVKLSVAALLPAEYIPSPNERMYYYRKLAVAVNDDGIANIAAEWQDRFGKPPLFADLLVESHRLRLAAAAVAADYVSVVEHSAMIQFSSDPPCADKLLEKITVGDCRLTAKNSVILPLPSEEPLAQANLVLAFLRSLT